MMVITRADLMAFALGWITTLPHRAIKNSSALILVFHRLDLDESGKVAVSASTMKNTKVSEARGFAQKSFGPVRASGRLIIAQQFTAGESK
jgi:hypothetical protein